MQLLTDLRAAREAARKANDACASLCTLSTVDAQGEPQARTLVLRELEERLAIFINASSPKWLELNNSESVSVLVYLPSQSLQYRLQAKVSSVPKSVVDASWLLRPDTPKRLDWYYEDRQPQSSRIVDPDALADRLTQLLPEVPTAAPPTAKGLYLDPIRIERLRLNNTGAPHERVCEVLVDGISTTEHLVP